MTISLILGGAKSGKSTFAEKQATRKSPGENVLYVATAEARDQEMKARIAHHQATRPQEWTTLEESHDLYPALEAVFESGKEYDVLLIDCITVWISNLILAETGEYGEGETKVAIPDNLQDNLLRRVENLGEFLCQLKMEVLLVANEVGGGVVPPYTLGRLYRDLAGMTNQILARYADRVFLVVAGIPLDLKQLETRIDTLENNTSL